jgi:hypothetical protein
VHAGDAGWPAGACRRARLHPYSPSFPGRSQKRPAGLLSFPPESGTRWCGYHQHMLLLPEYTTSNTPSTYAWSRLQTLLLEKTNQEPPPTNARDRSCPAWASQAYAPTHLCFFLFRGWGDHRPRSQPIVVRTWQHVFTYLLRWSFFSSSP